MKNAIILFFGVIILPITNFAEEVVSVNEEFEIQEKIDTNGFKKTFFWKKFVLHSYPNQFDYVVMCRGQVEIRGSVDLTTGKISAENFRGEPLENEKYWIVRNFHREKGVYHIRIYFDQSILPNKSVLTIVNNDT